MSFETFKFKEEINQVIEEMHFNEPTPIQEQVIPLVLKNKNIIGISQTGTGKTHAFLLPIINRINTNYQSVQAVITAPTRELAGQIFENIKVFQKYMPELRSMLVVGGKDRTKMTEKLTQQPHIVVGTPGRIKDLTFSQDLKITTASVMVIDEADMTLEFGYLEDIDAVCGIMKEDLQMMVFSATIPESLRPFLRKYLTNTVTVEIDKDQKTSMNVEHILIATKHKDRYEVLRKIMNIIDPYCCIIFTNTRTLTSEITNKLREDGVRVGEIHGDMQPRERKQMMRRIQNNEYQYIVATDIAARGIDIDGVSHVINMEFPGEAEFYIHRSGRCGRGKYTGVCFSMYDHDDEKALSYLERKGIEFKNMTIKNNEFVDLGARKKRENRVKEQTELEKEVQRIIKKPRKVKPGYKKKRKREIDKVVRKQKRNIIQQDIRRQKKQRAKQKQIERRKAEENDNW